MNFLRTNRAPILIGLILLGGWLWLRTSATPFASIDEFEALLVSGEPVVLEFFGNT